MGLCSTKEEATDLQDYRKKVSAEKLPKTKLDKSMSIIELELKHTKEYYENLLRTQEDEDNQDNGVMPSAKSFESDRSFPEKSLLSHSTNEEFEGFDKSLASPYKKENLLRACSNISIKGYLRRK